MKYIKQLGIILAVCFLAECIVSILPFTFPVSILAMLLMYILLSLKWIKEHHIAETSDLLLQLMPIFLIPSSVTIINYLSLVQNVWVQLVIICAVGVLVTFICAYWTTKWLMHFVSKGDEKHG